MISVQLNEQTMELLNQAIEFEANNQRFKSRDQKISAGKRAKELILKINEIYKKTKDQKLMDVMKRLTLIKQKAERRLKTPITP